MNEGIHLDLDTWIVPGQIRKANLCRVSENEISEAATDLLSSVEEAGSEAPWPACTVRSPRRRQSRGDACGLLGLSRSARSAITAYFRV